MSNITSLEIRNNEFLIVPDDMPAYFYQKLSSYKREVKPNSIQLIGDATLNDGIGTLPSTNIKSYFNTGFTFNPQNNPFEIRIKYKVSINDYPNPVYYSSLMNLGENNIFFEIFLEINKSNNYYYPAVMKFDTTSQTYPTTAFGCASTSNTDWKYLIVKYHPNRLTYGISNGGWGSTAGEVRQVPWSIGHYSKDLLKLSKGYSTYMTYFTDIDNYFNTLSNTPIIDNSEDLIFGYGKGVGLDTANTQFIGQIDFSESYIKINNEIVSPWSL